jgi:hypothetical protein
MNPGSPKAALPASYGRTRLVVLPVDPYAVHAYWEISPPALLETERRIERPVRQTQVVLRFHEVFPDSAEVREEAQAHSFDIEIRLEAQNWYVPLWAAGKSYETELGVRVPGGEFFTLVRGNRVQTPRAWPQSSVEEHFLRVSGEERHAEAIQPPDYRKPVQARVIATSQASLSASKTDAQALVDERAEVRVEAHAMRHDPGGRRRTEDTRATVESADVRPDMAGAAEEQFVPGIFSVSFQIEP